MKNGILSLTYSVAEPKTFLATTMEDGCSPLRFCIAMAERNKIPGILPVSQEFEDGRVVLYHDITGKYRLTDRARDLGEEAFLKVLGGLCQDLQGLPDYFLRAAHCLLDPAQTYVDRYGEAFLPLIPMADDAEDSSPLLQKVFMTLLGACVPVGGAPSPRLAPFIGYVIQPTFRLEEFAELFAAPKSAAPPPRPVAPTPQPPVQPPITPPVQPPVTPPVTPPVKEATPPASGGIKIPGMDGVIPPPVPTPAKPDKKAKKAEAKKEKEAKKEAKKSFGLFGKKHVEEKVDMEKQALLISDNVQIPPVGGSPYPPVRPVSPPPYTPAPAGGGDSSGGSRPWTGTVQLDTAGTTALFDQGGGRTAVLLHAGQRIVLADFPFTIGRSACRYTINNPNVSRTHVTIIRQGDSYFIQDENSSNHTYLNGSMLPPFTPTPLEPGSEIRLGNEYFQFQLEGM